MLVAGDRSLAGPVSPIMTSFALPKKKNLFKVGLPPAHSVPMRVCALGSMGRACGLPACVRCHPWP